jgi:starvation-inducible DNA-binding protein
MQDDLKKDFDMLAEHILAIGGKPFATMVKFIKEASIEEASADDEEREIVEQLQHDLGVIHKAIDAFVKETDDQTTYLLYQLMATIQKYDIQCRAYQRQ